jgi:phospholipid N-methyltransferase
MNEPYTYPGSELAFFEKAVNWKCYFASRVKPFLGKEVLEVGSGIGGTTQLLNNGTAKKWILLEPDKAMAISLERKIRDERKFQNCIIVNKTISELRCEEQYDTIIYIDVLEHIEDDVAEIKLATTCLQQGGHLIILSPAFHFLFSPFDKAIGHYRRYTTQTLKAVIPSNLALQQLEYLDSVGFFASLANKLLLQQNMPTEKQIMLWDNWMIPLSKWTDKLFFHSFGKSILGIWRKY